MQLKPDTLHRYFLEQSTPEEKEAIRKWLENDEAHKKEFIRERIHFDAIILTDENDMVGIPRKVIPQWIKYAATIAATVLILLLGFNRYHVIPFEKMASTSQTIHVPAGNYATEITLPDGTKVWLNANSTFKYPSFFDNDVRKVEHDGEGYFEVVKEAEKPFIVHTDKYDIKALGTKFSVEAYSANRNFKTLLYEGKVLVSNVNRTENIVLKPNQTAQLVDDKLNILNKADVNSIQWKDGIIYIDNISFESIMKLFEKYYDKKIIINNKKVKETGYRGKFRISDGIEHALNVLRKDFPFSYKIERESNQIFIN